MAVSGTLHSEARRQSMLEHLGKDGAIRLHDAAKEWHVHPMTIRRDFDLFVSRGLAKRVRGGIVAINGDDYEHRLHMNADAKLAIADKLGDLVEPGSVIAMDSSTTVGMLVQSLTRAKDLTIVTNGMRAFQALSGRRGVRAFLTGGFQEEHNEALVGPLAEAAVRQFGVDKAFMSVSSLDPEFGTSEVTMEQMSFKQALVDGASNRVIAVDSSKLGTKSRFRSFRLSERDILVTELDPADERLDPYRDDVAAVI